MATQPQTIEAQAAHPDLGLTGEQEANLRKLAAYLLTLPPEYPDFAMSLFSQDGAGEVGHVAHVCGTAACAAGHGPVAGIEPLPNENWGNYTARAFSGGNGRIFVWCFDEDWADVDNTAHGAARRILWMLANGIPANTGDQMYGDARLCYEAEASA